MKKIIGYLTLVASLCVSLPPASAQAPDTITLTSSAFAHETPIPFRFSAYGDNISPDLSWSNLPEGTQELALILDDPVVDMPQPFVHWVAYNIPVTANGLTAALATDAIVAAPGLEGMINGINGTNRSGYFGPRPPVDGKVHKYHFRIYALDRKLNLPDGLNKSQLLEEISRHILATGTLIGDYEQKE